MRVGLLFLGGLMLTGSACTEKLQDDPPGGAFTLKAEVIEALEGGPVVFRVTLTCHGTEPVEMFFANPEPDGCAFSTPNGWERIEPYITGGTSNGWGGGYRTVKPGDHVSKTVYMHEQFKRIPSGRASLKVSWGVKLGGQRAAEITTPFDLDVAPATPERLARIRKRMEAELDRPALTEADRRGMARWILGTRHRTFVPVALRLITSWDRLYDVTRLMDFAYSVAEDPNAVTARLVALAREPTWEGRVDLFRYWRSRCEDDPTAPNTTRAEVDALVRDPEKAFLVDLIYPYWPYRRVALPAREFTKLLDAKNTWTKILTYVTFPSRCPRDWTQTLLKDCHQLTQPLSPSQAAPLLRELNNDDFAVREKASDQLRDLGERAEFSLRQALRTDLAPEAKLRIRSLLDGIADRKEDPEWKDILERVAAGTWKRNASINVLRALSQGRPDAKLTKAAVESLHKLTTRK